MHRFFSHTIAASVGFVLAFVLAYFHFTADHCNRYHFSDEDLKFARLGREITAEYKRQEQLISDLAADLREEFKNDPHIIIGDDASVSFDLSKYKGE